MQKLENFMMGFIIQKRSGKLQKVKQIWWQIRLGDKD